MRACRILLLLVVCFLFGSSESFAQCGLPGTPPCNKEATKPKVTPKKTATSNNKKKPVTLDKPKAQPKSNVKTIQVPLLAIQLRLMLVKADGTEVEANPLATFTQRDRLRLSVKANQPGFLYIIRQKSQEEGGEIIFPTSLVNNGSNLVAANTEYELPSNCSKSAVPDPRDCSLTLFPVEESPQEFFTLVFTRDRLVDLPNDVKNTRVSLANLMSDGKIGAKTLVDLIEDSGQDLVAQQGDTPFAVRIINTNAKDNEEIIEIFVLNKSKR